MRRSLRFALMFAAVLGTGGPGGRLRIEELGQQLLGSSSGSSVKRRLRLGASKSYDNGSSDKGGVYRVGWEQSFGFTNNFDPTGEYLGNAWGSSEPAARPLVGYKHQPGAAGNERSAISPPQCRSPATTA